MIRFEWDPTKERSNRRKHDVSFDDAAEVFRDRFHVTERDDGDYGETRWKTFGMVEGQLLLVVHTIDEMPGGELIRIISARQISRHEREDYEGV